jgi:pimeloyl-ACP methyl ester carboxylesterase
MIRRHLISVGGRTVHYRTAGSGPPLVMLHGSPGDSQMLVEEIAACAENFTVFALDTPGFGYSDALPGETLTVTDLAAATAEAMRALSLPPCPVYGTHTGAAIAIELGVGWPEQVSGLLMEGLPAFTPAEMAELFRGYFAPMVADPLGGHLISSWVRFRDQFTWFPWPSRDVRRLNALDRPDAAAIDLWVSMFYRSCKTYKPAYFAACHYGQATARAAELRLPAIYTATVEDMLFPHLDRLPPLQPGQRIAPLPSDARIAAIASYVLELPGGLAQGNGQVAAPEGQLFIDGPHGQIYLRRYGDTSLPALVLLHDAPGTSLGLDALATGLAGTVQVIVPDHPGSGRSDAFASGDVLAAAADNVLAVADALGLRSLRVAGAGAGAAVAAKLAERRDQRISRFLVADILPREAGLVAPSLPFSDTGAHWAQAWLMLRDAQVYHPWYAGTVAAQRRRQGNFDADWLHAQTVALMEGRATYHELPRAAALFPTAEVLASSGADVTYLPDEAFLEELLDVRYP